MKLHKVPLFPAQTPVDKAGNIIVGDTDHHQWVMWLVP
jgi:hypothetical protein